MYQQIALLVVVLSGCAAAPLDVPDAPDMLPCACVVSCTPFACGVNPNPATTKCLDCGPPRDSAPGCAGCLYSGQCVAGSADSMCGAGGVVCARCDVGASCVEGRCTR